MTETPDRVKHLGILYLAVGAVNLTVGWAISSSLMAFVGGTCTTIVTLGLCPVGVFCGFLPMLMLPLSAIEIGLGIALLVTPDSLKGMFRTIPFVLMAMILIGDLLSAIAGVIGFALGRDDDIRAWAES